ncbi:ASCH domain-containing protein [Paenibacillus sp. CGMCC 1.16610]|uniref:ASCH domain-containing protein n=1 Tax=Paenibacillus anseongense TaxID=2682845 RepID=A0ABW9UD14_9BACL|nr:MULTISPECIES: ASCH domain-containing protein [Paenibacillus]MBA2943929.1 ASCH domain-containing protein [Paenibacillus sp. CGMCC 1.16610]MVQ37818.1 ASCH domain-containing protein [Paenibacillus anseongense]
MKVLLSIKPEFVEQIIKGNKKFEYRKRIFKKQVESVVIYSTMPVGKIIGEFTIDKIINDSPDVIWDLTNRYSGISEIFFRDYFIDKIEGFAIEIKEFREYETPIEPQDIFKGFVAPQSYRYIDDAELRILTKIS